MIGEVTERRWDAVVIGGGLGGGLTARRLAEAGLAVLIVEKGRSPLGGETHELDDRMADPVARKVRGYWPSKLKSTIDGRESENFGPLGSGVGGTSAFYAAALERLEPHDFDDSEERPHPTGGWPISYNAFSPYYEEAERLLEVRGGTDPLSEDHPGSFPPPPSLSEADEDLTSRLQANGLHPYRMHVGIRYKPGCLECIGRKCPKDCKLDGRNAGVGPALATGRATLLERAEVRKLHLQDGRIARAEVAVGDGNDLVDLKADTFVLAAGGFSSARLLLASAGEAAPGGLANTSGMVGRNLMFHVNERLALWPRPGLSFDGPQKTTAFRDFYYVEGRRLGLVHSMGLRATYWNIHRVLQDKISRTPFADVKIVDDLLQVPAILASRYFGDAKIFCALVEDLPDPENRIEVDPVNPDRIIFRYDASKELIERRKFLRRTLRKKFKGIRSMYLNDATEPNIGHPCGLLRFGNDPRKSVLDPSCKAHGIGNLYVADSSFMPTSGGVNPSLTIAANALRVADAIVDRAQPTIPVPAAVPKSVH